MRRKRGVLLTQGFLAGLFFIQRYRFLTIAQFGKTAGVSYKHAAEVLRWFDRRGIIGFFGGVSLMGHGKTPKVYFLRRKGWEYLLEESDYPPEEIGRFVEVNQEITWSPSMYHRLRLLDLFIALEMQVALRPHLSLVRTFLEYRRLPGSHLRETTDYVSTEEIAENRIVPDGAFVLENRETGRRGLFLVEMDMGTERIVAISSTDKRVTIRGKFLSYDRYLQSGRFAKKYVSFGDFRNFSLLFVTKGLERIETIRGAVADLPQRLHQYYRLADFEEVLGNFLGTVWKSRDEADTRVYALVGQA